MSTTVDSHLKLAHALAEYEVEALIDRGDAQQLATYAKQHLESKYALLPPEELRAIIAELDPDLLET